MSESRSIRALIERAQNVQPLLLTPDEAAVSLRLAPNSVHHLIRDGRLRCIRVPLGGKRQVRRVPVVELSRFVERLMAEQSEQSAQAQVGQ